MTVKKKRRKAYMGWYKPKISRFTFEKIGYPDLWVDLRLSGSFTYGETKAIQAKFASSNTGEVNPEIMEEVMSMEIVGWNLTHPETDKPLPVPSKDAKSIDALPLEFIVSIQESLAIAMQEVGPNALTPNGSGPGSKEQPLSLPIGQEKFS
jgi:hypothetical protein